MREPSMIKRIRVGTRQSPLALWQAQTVVDLLAENGTDAEIVLIKSEGDLNLTTPLYELGIQGIFTKSLDIALLDGRIDVAVHSYKDVPTSMAAGLQVGAVLKRGNPYDVLVCRNETSCPGLHEHNHPFIIATSSIRRKAQWLYKFRNSRIENIRGNVNSRIQKLQQSEWHGAIFAAAGLERLCLTEQETGPQVKLDFMLPAPAQGAVVLVCRADDKEVIKACAYLNHEHTAICTGIERNFLRSLHGGCSTPISAFATVNEDEINFVGNITAADGSKSISVEMESPVYEHAEMAVKAAAEITAKGGLTLLNK